MRYIILDSHKNISKERRNSLAEFFVNAGKAGEGNADIQVNFCTDYEKQYAVKWFEVMAVDKGKTVGYLRCLRDPDDPVRWYIGDVYVLKAYRGHKTATNLYLKAFDELAYYDAAEYVIASVDRDNKPSINLHTGLGFYDTKKPCNFADFYDKENETCYLKQLFQYYPVPGADTPVVEKIFPIWAEYAKTAFPDAGEKELKAELKDLLSDSVSGRSAFYAIWNGLNLVGFKYEKDGKTVEYKSSVQRTL